MAYLVLISEPLFKLRHLSSLLKRLYPRPCVSLFCIYYDMFGILISFSQMTNTIQKKYKVSSTQLLYQSCPYQAMTLFISGPFLDKFLTNQNVFTFKYTPDVLVRITTESNTSLCS